mmetsp:Transcript_26429/g.48368  ORF Transcript_26429/g.48368 Transcript_26429/m.48368 type:complete len:476 (-) Transcript_26429:15-1442(-)
MLQVTFPHDARFQRSGQRAPCCNPQGKTWKQSLSRIGASQPSRLQLAVCAGFFATLPDRIRQRRRGRKASRNHRHGLHAAATSTDSSAEEFLQWASTVGVEVTSKVQIAPAAGLIRRRVLATSPIAPGETLVVLPTTATISVDAAAKSAPPPELADLGSWWARFPRSTFQIAVLLAAQQERFKPYIAMLPELEDVEAPWRWPEEHLRYLSDPVAAAARAKRKALEEAWQELDDLGWGARVPKDIFFRAQHAAASRAFTGEAAAGNAGLVLGGGAAIVLCAIAGVFAGVLDVDGAAVIACLGLVAGLVWSTTAGSDDKVLTYLPVIDQVNHQSGPPPDLDLDPSTGAWRLTASRAYGVGDEVVFSYGDKDNDNLLLQHGFVEEDNPFDNVTLSSPKGADVRLSRGGEAVLVSASGPSGELQQVAVDALQAAEGQFDEAEDAEIMKTVKPRQRAELIVQWRAERRRLLLEGRARWLT